MRNKIGLVLVSFVLSITLGFSHIGFANAAKVENAAESRIIPYPAGYVTTTEGASSYNGLGNVKQSPYYRILDFYNLQSTDTLMLLPHYKTYQQTTEITCGPAAADIS